MTPDKAPPFSGYQKMIVAALAGMLFTIVVDYMTLPALSAILLPELQISTKEFGWIVSAYAFSAGISGFLATGFADSFDRKKLLLLYYGGFLLGMLLCTVANSLIALLLARVVSGIFGGVVASICYAMVADLFAADQRGRVMGFVQLAFAGGLVAGLPLALLLATNVDWHLPYLALFLLGLILLSTVYFVIKPLDGQLRRERTSPSPQHSLAVIKNQQYWALLANNVFLVLGDVMFMTFSSAYLTNNLGVSVDNLPIVFGLGGLATILCSPLIGRATDRYGKWWVFVVATVLTIVAVAFFSNLGNVAFGLVATVHTLLFVGINARMIAATAMTTMVPKRSDRGAFMALDAALQQLAGGVAAVAVGWIVYQTASGYVERYPALGAVVIGVMILTLWLMHKVQVMIKERLTAAE
jgi:predicted MFS family arabinose efflux permease